VIYHDYMITLNVLRSLMEEPIENKFMTTSPIFWYGGILFMMIGIHFGKPRLFFSTKLTTEQILSSVDKFKVNSKHYYFFLLNYKYYMIAYIF
jgi:hypothetical protein